MHTSQVAHHAQAGAYPGFRGMKRLGKFLLPPGWDASPSQGTPSIKSAGTHLYTWVERGTVRVKCLAQEHSGMSQARARTWSARSGVERTNHEATAPPKPRYSEHIFPVPWPFVIMRFRSKLFIIWHFAFGFAGP